MNKLGKNERERERVQMKRNTLEKLQKIMRNRRIPSSKNRWTEEETLKEALRLIKELESSITSKGMRLPKPPLK